jgi:hypothetical protein
MKPQIPAERVAEALEHFGLGGSREQNIADIESRRRNAELDAAVYIRPEPKRKVERVGGIRIN